MKTEKVSLEVLKEESTGLSEKDYTSNPKDHKSPEDEILMVDTRDMIIEYFNEGVMTLELAKAYKTLYEIGDIQQIKYINKILTKKYGKKK